MNKETISADESSKNLMNYVNKALEEVIKISLKNNTHKFNVVAEFDNGTEINITAFLTSSGDMSLYATANIWKNESDPT